MPATLSNLLGREDDSNKIKGVVRTLANLLAADRNVEIVYLCNPETVQISKLRDEGNTFCGYRNLQMLLTSIVSSDSTLDVTNPNVLDLQDMIERAWDKGLNAHGRYLVGCLAGTRKYIGSSEVEAVLTSLDVACTGHAFAGKSAHIDLVDFVEGYFSADVGKETIAAGSTVRLTSRHPIFLQRPGHSITIVGLERSVHGRRRILAFDPAWQPPSQISQSGRLSIVDTKRTGRGLRRTLLLGNYRKPSRYLRRFSSFEAVTVE